MAPAIPLTDSDGAQAGGRNRRKTANEDDDRRRRAVTRARVITHQRTPLFMPQRRHR